MPQPSVLHLSIVASGLVTTLLACGTPAAAQAQAPVQAIPVAASVGSAQPRLSRTPGGDVVLSWLEPGSTAGHTRLRVAEIAGGTWSAPRTVAEGAGWFVNWADVPGVVPVTDTTWASFWLERSTPASRYAYDVRVALSYDAGRTWGRAITPHTDRTPTEHGFVSIFPWATGTGAPTSGKSPAIDVGLAWLDGRAMATGNARAGHAGDMALRAARLAADGSLHDETMLDARVCECCPTAAVDTADGVLVAYRDRAADETRDTHVVRLARGAWEPDRVAVADRWQIAACPVNGPALAARGHDVTLAWFTAADDQPRVKASLSRDGGRTWGPPHIVDEGRALGRIGVAAHPLGGAVVVWIEAEASGASVRIRRVNDDTLGPSAIVARVSQSRLSGYPRIVAAAGGFVLAWVDEEDSATRVRTARLDVSDVP